MKARVKSARRIDADRLLADVDLVTLLDADGVKLRKESSSSRCGPCPKCGGEDRFVVRPHGRDGKPPGCWCRQCWPEPGGDAIGYIRWRDRVGFLEACETLARWLGRSLGDYWDLSWRRNGAGPSSAPRAKGQPERVHVYHNAAGAPVLQVRIWRLPGGRKKVLQCLPHGRGGSKSGGGQWPDGRPLYRLPQVLVADSAEPVYVVEGEKDADRLARLGLVSTTSAMGAGKAHLSDWSPLEGRDVVILPDHDRPGFDHARAVAKLATTAGARRVRLVPLPGFAVGDALPDAHGRDISDWLTEGHALANLRAAVSAARDWQDESVPGAVRLVWAPDIEPEPVEWLWQPRIPLGALTILGGDPGVGKSYLACAIAAGVTLGRGRPGSEPGEQGRALYVTAEDHLARTLQPRLGALGADLGRVSFLVEGDRPPGACAGPVDPRGARHARSEHRGQRRRLRSSGPHPGVPGRSPGRASRQ